MLSLSCLSSHNKIDEAINLILTIYIILLSDSTSVICKLGFHAKGRVRDSKWQGNISKGTLVEKFQV